MTFRYHNTIAKCVWWEATGCVHNVLNCESQEICPNTNKPHVKSIVRDTNKRLRFDDFEPVHCDCGFEFKGYSLTLRTNFMMRNIETKQEMLISDLPVGAVFVSPYPMPYEKGFDGLSIVVVTPEGQWRVDSRSSNCTKPDDIVHRCWVRHGTVGEQLHIDKDGVTCAAGAGSIIMGNFHGFVHHGELRKI